MSRKNSGFAADLAAGIDLSDEPAPQRRTGIASNVLTGRSNRLNDLASGAIVSRTHELWTHPGVACGPGTIANIRCSAKSAARTSSKA